MTDASVEQGAVQEGGDDEFDSGFDVSTATPAAQPEQAEPTEPAAEAPAAEAPPADEVIQIRKSDWDRLTSRVAALDTERAGYKKQFDTAFGSLGGLKAQIDKIQQGTPAGQPISDDDLRELAEQFGDDFANLSIWKKMRGTGGGAVDAPAFEELLVKERASVQDLVQRQATEIAERAIERKFVKRDHPDMDAHFYGTPDANGQFPATTPFKDWLATQPDDYRLKVANSWDSTVLSEALSKFKNAKPGKTGPGADKSAQQRRMAAAMPVKGDAPVAKPIDDDDDFNAGFKSG